MRHFGHTQFIERSELFNSLSNLNTPQGIQKLAWSSDEDYTCARIFECKP
jgi:hypothetical protein